MKRIFEWLKTHKLTASLSTIVLVLVSQYFQGPRGMTGGGFAPMMQDAYVSNYGSGGVMSEGISAPSMPSSLSMGKRSMSAPSFDSGSTNIAVSPDQRKVVRNSDLALHVKNVRESIDQIVQHAESNNGFMVNSSTQTPEQGGTGHISIRVPADRLDSTLDFLRGISVTVISENISGSDVTDQFTDAQARLQTLTNTKATFERIMLDAVDVDEILRVQNSILQVQDQIDSIKGQLQYLEKTSESSLISIYLSTDELALPYSPTESWRPQVVFKTAVRSFVGNMRRLGSAGIWLAVYSPIIIVVAVIIVIAKRIMRKPNV